MRDFSKSKLMAFRQCPKRLWLELHRPELKVDSAATQASFQAGCNVGDIARTIYDPAGLGALIDVESEGFDGAFARTGSLIQSTRQPIFEAGFCAGGALAFADVLQPVQTDNQQAWRMVEVKSSTSVKDHYRDDVAVQAYVARAAGVPLQHVALAHIDSSWVYPGGGDYRGLLKENDLTEEAFGRSAEVQSWIENAAKTAASQAEPAIETGEHCNQPYACGFYAWCNRNAIQPTHPVHWLPNIGAKAKMLAEQGITELKDVPDKLLTDKQLRVKTHTVENTVFFDAAGAAAELAKNVPSNQTAYFLDFESTIFVAVPIWAGTCPYQQICFQFSLHKLSVEGELTHEEFLDISGADPSPGIVQALIAACGKEGAIFVYSAYERTKIRELAERFPDRATELLALVARIVDLLPISREHYYHPDQQGSWSIKDVLPTVAPELSYDALDGVQDGGMASKAFLEAIHQDTTPERKALLAAQLLAYCKLDTYAMVRLWQVFAGRTDLKL